MTVIQFPVFVKGQTLTDDDLNDLRDSLEEIDRRTARSIGFRDNCGLGGSVTGTTLTIGTGIAIDQLGHVLELDAPFTVGLAPTPSPDQPPGFIDTRPGGFTPVLQFASRELPARHATRRAAKATPSSARSAPQSPFSTAASRTRCGTSATRRCSTQVPLLVRKSGTVIGGFVALRTAILNRMGNRLDNDARTKLSGLTVDSDLPAIQGFKASFSNKCGSRPLDLLRCEFEISGVCVNADGGVGVALGWVDRNGTGWSWDVASATTGCPVGVRWP